MIFFKFILYILAILSVACSVTPSNTSEKPHRTELHKCLNNKSDQNCGKHIFVELAAPDSISSSDKNAHLAFLEFSDLGLVSIPGAPYFIYDSIKNLNQVEGALLMVVFVHGWHHNASEDDPNVQSFQRFLIDLQHEENLQAVADSKISRTHRQVVGVYIGWRGETIYTDVIKEFTYRTRKSSALRVGQYGLQEALAELNKIRNSDPKNRLVATGHSFGGGLLYSSVLQNLVDKVVLADRSTAESTHSNAVEEIGKAYGDLVILMNPALEAVRVETLHRRLKGAKFDINQPLVMASFTSENDAALSKAFPLGQKLFFQDDIKAATVDSSTRQVITAYGLYEKYRTHELSCSDCIYSEDTNTVFLTITDFIKAACNWDGFRGINDQHIDKFKVGSLSLTQSPYSDFSPNAPIMNVYVKGDNIIKDHNAIWGDDFTKFIRALIGMEFATGNSCKKR